MSQLFNIFPGKWPFWWMLCQRKAGWVCGFSPCFLVYLLPTTCGVCWWPMPWFTPLFPSVQGAELTSGWPPDSTICTHWSPSPWLWFNLQFLLQETATGSQPLQHVQLPVSWWHVTAGLPGPHSLYCPKGWQHPCQIPPMLIMFKQQPLLSFFVSCTILSVLISSKASISSWDSRRTYWGPAFLNRCNKGHCPDDEGVLVRSLCLWGERLLQKEVGRSSWPGYLPWVTSQRHLTTFTLSWGP